jgi:LysR family carnitine catabolism transcriptional activator
MKIEHLRFFLAVVEAGELAEAGARVGRTPAALSIALRQLEEELQGSLFEGERKARLSALGEHVHGVARRMVTDFDSARESMRAYASGSQGVVKVAAVPTAATRLLPTMTLKMRQSHPQVRIDLRDTDSQSVAEAINGDEVDFGIGTLPQGVRDIDAFPLINDPFVLVCPDQHRLTALKRPIRWEDIKGTDFIANGLCAKFPAAKIQQLVRDSRLMIHNTTSLLTYVKNGLGVTVLPQMAITRNTGLTCLPLADRTASRSVELLKKKGASLSPAAEVLYRYAVHCAAKIATPPA